MVVAALVSVAGCNSKPSRPAEVGTGGETLPSLVFPSPSPVPTTSLAPVILTSTPADWQRPPYGKGAQIGQVYEGYKVDTHCGVWGAQIDGTVWEADPPLRDPQGNGNSPPGWHHRSETGALVLWSENLAQFTSAGKSAFFKRADLKTVCQ